MFFLGVGLIDEDTFEIYAGEWKHDRRDGFGVCERSDGTKYEGEWLANRRNGYGVTYYPDGKKEGGQYKDDIFLSDSHNKKWLNGLILARKKRDKEKLASSVAAAQKAAQIASQKSDIANSRFKPIS
ncbi:hypothetical protein HELRODRAFT_86828 [Helobdella robusta]|uniref:Uncharacterized protein n=1 Tax=Helobdella robusta TaxID=6412 RepID=T1G6H7_HELRO|nr:hypothetical protein HELRODRAFT_86828 [Helobdella robusta]ESN95376.1 hypothetical protein HELRODRAFT_86828 [Helobdella robusta]